MGDGSVPGMIVELNPIAALVLVGSISVLAIVLMLRALTRKGRRVGDAHPRKTRIALAALIVAAVAVPALWVRWFRCVDIDGDRRCTLSTTTVGALDGAREDDGSGDAAWARLPEADLTGQTLNRFDFEGADLRRALMDGVDLRGSRFDGAQMAGVQLAGADAADARFVDADLTGAVAPGARLADATFERARMQRSNLADVGARRSNFGEASLQGASLVRADLADARLVRADLRDADLTGADLSRADFTGANMAGANVTGATLDGAVMAGVDLSAVIGLTQTQSHALAPSEGDPAELPGYLEGSCVVDCAACPVSSSAPPGSACPAESERAPQSDPFSALVWAISAFNAGDSRYFDAFSPQLACYWGRDLTATDDDRVVVRRDRAMRSELVVRTLRVIDGPDLPGDDGVPTAWFAVQGDYYKTEQRLYRGDASNLYRLRNIDGDWLIDVEIGANGSRCVLGDGPQPTTRDTQTNLGDWLDGVPWEPVEPRPTEGYVASDEGRRWAQPTGAAEPLGAADRWVVVLDSACTRQAAATSRDGFRASLPDMSESVQILQVRRVSASAPGRCDYVVALGPSDEATARARSVGLSEAQVRTASQPPEVSWAPAWCEGPSPRSYPGLGDYYLCQAPAAE